MAWGSLAPDAPDDPFERAALRQRQAVQPEGGRAEGKATAMFGSLVPGVMGAIDHLAHIPERAFQAVDQYQKTGDYNPAPFVETAANMFGIGGPVAMAAGVRDTLGAAGGSGIRAYHGSPHDFDKFDLSKIGTGEGAQAYGHGLYFAENEGVAKGYRDNVKDMGAVKDINARLSELARGMDTLKVPGQYGKFRTPEGYQLKAEYDALMDSRSNVINQPGHMYEVNINAHPDQFLDWDKPIGEPLWNKVDPKIRAAADDALDSRGMNTISDEPGIYTGRELYKTLQHHDVHESLPSTIGTSDWIAGNTTEKRHVAEYLHEHLGLPGIKFLDQGSRNPGLSSLKPAQLDARIASLQSDIASGGGNQSLMRDQLAGLERDRDSYKNLTSNYVVFNDKLIDVLRKYGIPGMLGTGGFGALAPNGGVPSAE